MLSDKEILELNELCSALVDGALTEAQKTRLEDWLGRSEEARQFYVRVLSLSASLCHYAGEMHSDEPDIVPLRGSRGNSWLWWAGPLAAAACVAAVLWFFKPSRQAQPLADAKADEFVARLTASKDCQWASGAALSPGSPLRGGQRLELTKGFAEITFDSGAQVVLEGPAALDITSAWDTR